MKHLTFILFLWLVTPNSTPLAQMPPPMPGEYIFTGPQYVINEPFSSVVENEHVQILADGTHILAKTELHLFRDSDGRTRRETYLIKPDVQQDQLAGIVIRDPVTGVIYNLQVQNRTAFVTKITPPLKPAPSSQPPIPQPPPVQPAGVQPPTGPHPTVTTEDLGTQIIEGCEAHGRRTTRTTPTGVQGNDRPLTLVQEEWNCFELRMMMLLTTTDPRLGNTTVRVTRLDRIEPDPVLFQVPADYKTIESRSSSLQQ